MQLYRRCYYLSGRKQPNTCHCCCAELTLLLNWSKSFSNLAEVAQSAPLIGWSAASVNEPCSWTGIYCGADGGFGISLRNLGLSGAQAAVKCLARRCFPAWGACWPANFARHHKFNMQVVLTPAASGAGRFDPSWDALGPMLQSMNMDSSILPYQLPPSWGQAWQNVTFMSFGGAQLASTLPREWGVEGAFKQLFQLWLYSNPGLTGGFGFLCMACWKIMCMALLHAADLHASCSACHQQSCFWPPVVRVLRLYTSGKALG